MPKFQSFRGRQSGLPHAPSWPLLACVAFLVACSDSDRSSSAEADASTEGDAAVSAPRDELARSVANSATHSCALREAGLYCWGANFAGQLGTETTTASELPLRATFDPSDVVELAAATGRTCVRRSSGEVACWGENEQGQIGDGTRTASLTPSAASGIDDARQLALDEVSTCVLREAGSVACWGASPEGAPERGSLLPTPIEGLDDVVELRGAVTGLYCARGRAGWVRCWTRKDGAWTEPTEPEALRGARAIAVTGPDILCAVMSDDEILCHDLGNGVTTPLQDSGGSKNIVGTQLVACTLNAEVDIRCWNILPPMLESVGSPPIDLVTDMPIRELAVGGFRFCARRADDSVWCGNANTAAPRLTEVSELPP